MDEFNNMLFASRYSIGENVILTLKDKTISCYVRAVTFTSSKVRYAVIVKDGDVITTLHNIDSCLLSDGDGSKDMDIVNTFDNYS